MTDTTITTDLSTLPVIASPPPQHKVTITDKSTGKRLEVRGKLKVALDLMVYGPMEGPTRGKAMRFDEAARAADYGVPSMRRALERPHVVEYLRRQKQVFRNSASAQNISRAIELRDQDENKTAAMNAIRFIEGVPDDEQAAIASRGVKAGVVVVINTQRPAEVQASQRVIELNPVTAAADETPT